MALQGLLLTIFLGCHFDSHALRIAKIAKTAQRQRWHRHWPQRWGRYHYHPRPQKSPYIQIPPDVDVLPKDNSNLLGAQCNWGGMNSYFLYAQEVTNQHKTLKAMSDWGLKVLRIFIDTVPRNHKNTKSQFVDFLEPDHMGPPYKTQVLDLINDLMVRAHDYGVKLAIAMHDRYSLGCYACDGYQKELGLFCAPAHNKKCGPLNDASEFYTNATAISYYDQRLEFILKYRNLHFNKTWGELKEVVAMFEVQNEAHGFDPRPWPNDWHCERAKVMKAHMDPAIYIGTGGGRTFSESTLIEHFNCSEIDVVTLHDYDACTWLEMDHNLTDAKKLSMTYNKKILYEEFGNQKQSYRPDYYYAILTAANRNGIPFMPWEFLIPPSTGDQGGFEFDTHQASYPVLVFGVLVANRTAATHRWSNLELCGVDA